MRDVRTLRTLALLDLESHPPAAAIDRVTIVIDPTPGRVVQHTLFTRAQPTPEQLSTLLARLGALMGQDRIGAPAAVDTDRPGAFAMRPFSAVSPYPFTLDPVAQSPEPCSPRFSPCVSACAAAASPCPRAWRSTTAGPCASRPIAARSPAAPFSPAPARGGPRATGGRRPALTGRAGQADPRPTPWDRDEWDVTLGDGGVYRIFRDRRTGGWFIDAIVD